MFEKANIDKILQMYRSSMLIILVLILVFSHSILITQERFYIFYTFFIGIYIITCILTSKMHISLKITLSLIIISLYSINFKFMTEFIVKISFLSYTIPITLRTNDYMARNIVTGIFSSNFKLHTEFDKLPGYPSILICNYCKDRIENFACILFPLDLAIMMRDGFAKAKFHELVKWPIFTKAKDNYEDTKMQVKQHISSGRSVFTYITKPPSIKLGLSPYVRTGAFSIAKQLNIPITLVCIDYIDTRFGSITKQNFRIRVGDTFIVEDVQESRYKSKLFFKHTIKEFIKRKYE